MQTARIAALLCHAVAPESPIPTGHYCLDMNVNGGT